MKIVLFLSAILFSQFTWSQQITADDREFILAAHNLWELEAYNQSQQADEYLNASKNLVKKYKAEELPAKNFPHAQVAEQSLFFLFEKTISIYEVALKSSKGEDSFFELIDMATINLRRAIMETMLHQELKTSLTEAALRGIAEILKNGTSEATATELHFVYTFVYDWEDVVLKQEDKEPVKSGGEHIERAQSALAQIKNQATPPSSRSLKTAENVILQIINILKKANECASELHGFINLSNPHLEKLFKALEDGLTIDKSLSQIDSKVTKVSLEAVAEMSRCEQR